MKSDKAVKVEGVENPVLPTNLYHWKRIWEDQSEHGKTPYIPNYQKVTVNLGEELK